MGKLEATGLRVLYLGGRRCAKMESVPDLIKPERPPLVGLVLELQQGYRRVDLVIRQRARTQRWMRKPLNKQMFRDDGERGREGR